jgi:hypothetical protein
LRGTKKEHPPWKATYARFPLVALTFLHCHFITTCSSPASSETEKRAADISWTPEAVDLDDKPSRKLQAVTLVYNSRPKSGLKTPDHTPCCLVAQLQV